MISGTILNTDYISNLKILSALLHFRCFRLTSPQRLIRQSNFWHNSHQIEPIPQSAGTVRIRSHPSIHTLTNHSLLISLFHTNTLTPLSTYKQTSSHRRLAENFLHGTIPSWICEVPDINITMNSFVCPVPDCCDKDPLLGGCNPCYEFSPSPSPAPHRGHHPPPTPFLTNHPVPVPPTHQVKREREREREEEG